VITYDDSDGWYDHQAPPQVNGSDDSSLDTALCEAVPVRLGGANDRCGFGPRLPLLVISPWSRVNKVSHTLLNQASIIRFIEDNWLHSERIGHGSFDVVSGSLDGPGGLFNFSRRPHDNPVLLSPTTGEVSP
jgi:phospholipase C